MCRSISPGFWIEWSIILHKVDLLLLTNEDWKNVRILSWPDCYSRAPENRKLTFLLDFHEFLQNSPLNQDSVLHLDFCAIFWCSSVNSVCTSFDAYSGKKPQSHSFRSETEKNWTVPKKGFCSFSTSGSESWSCRVTSDAFQNWLMITASHGTTQWPLTCACRSDQVWPRTHQISDFFCTNFHFHCSPRLKNHLPCFICPPQLYCYLFFCVKGESSSVHCSSPLMINCYDAYLCFVIAVIAAAKWGSGGLFHTGCVASDAASL